MKKQLVLFLTLALCLGLTACGDTESDDTQSGYETVMDMEFLDGMWSIDGTAKLYFNLSLIHICKGAKRGKRPTSGVRRADAAGI